jgi:hypothetical protein
MGKNQDPGSRINIPDPQHWFQVRSIFSWGIRSLNHHGTIIKVLVDGIDIYLFYDLFQFIPDPDLDFLPVLDPGGKKAPDPGSGSVTLVDKIPF